MKMLELSAKVDSFSDYSGRFAVPVCSVWVVHAASGAALAGIEWT